MDKPSYYAVIPATVRYDENLRQIDKLLYAEITALSNQSGICFASNGYFANLYGLKPDTVSKRISNLANNGYIDVELDNKDKDNTKRTIKLTEKGATLSRFSAYGGIGQKSQHNIKDINNINSANQKCYGKYENVYFTDSQYEQLKAEFNDYEMWIERASKYCNDTGKKYKNFLLAIKRWSKKENAEKGQVIDKPKCKSKDLEDIKNLFG